MVNLWDFLDRAAALAPRAPAISQRGVTLDYEQVHRAALQLADTLVQRGVQRGDRVACLMHNHGEHFLAYFAAAAAGAILVPLNTRLLAGEQRAILAHSGVSMLLHDEAHDERARELLVSHLRVPDCTSAASAIRFSPRLAASAEPAQVYYTSGTTGDAKGVVLTHGNVCTHAITAAQELALGPGDRWAHIAPMFHLADAWATFALTHVAGSHVFLPQFTAAAALELLAHEQATITNLVPTMLNLMVKAPQATQHTYRMRLVLSGGAAIAPDTVRRILQVFSCDYVQTYGMTETSPYLTLSLLPPALRQLPIERQLYWKCKTGRPFAGIDLRVVDDDGQNVPADARTVGEIRVRGATVTPGYWCNPAATAAAFDEQGFLRTGDLATLDEHGFIDIVDRQKDVIKTGGETVYSIEVEHVLNAHMAVLECAVFGVADSHWGERVVAAVVLRPDQTATAAELIAFCREHVAAYKAPKEVRFLAALPRTGSGKITKRALRLTIAVDD